MGQVVLQVKPAFLTRPRYDEIHKRRCETDLEIPWLYLEPDGDVLREQGRTTVLGNATTDDWGEIWQKAGK